MKKLTEPVNTEAVSMLDDMIKRKKREDYAKRLSAYRDYIVRRYTVFEKKKDILENVGSSKIVTEEDKDAIHSSFNTSFKKRMKEKELKKVYEECEGVCPYCGNGKIEEVDHYVPKENYPEFTLYPNNLIPLCNKCNKKKGDKFVDTRNERQFINFYSDCIDDIPFLNVEIDFDPSDIKRTTEVKYTADFSKILDSRLRKIVKDHYKYLDLLCRYNEAAADEISELLSVLQGQPDREKSRVKIMADGWILGKRDSQRLKAGSNDWKYLLYEKLYAIKYADELVEYVCTNKAVRK